MSASTPRHPTWRSRTSVGTTGGSSRSATTVVDSTSGRWPPVAAGNFGLQFMRERAELIGARLDVRSRPDGGTVVRLTIPTSARRE